jgi:hypothetical protein
LIFPHFLWCFHWLFIEHNFWQLARNTVLCVHAGMCGEVYSDQHMKQGSSLAGPHSSIFKLLSSWAFLWELQIVHMSSFQISLLVLEFIKICPLYWFVLFWHSVCWSSNITSNDSLCHTLLNAYVKNLLYLATVMLKTAVFF